MSETKPLKNSIPILRKLIGKKIKFEYPNRFQKYYVGTIDDISSREIYICGDWFYVRNMKNIEQIEF